MALTQFIKQLVQTDSVFGAEAKKVTGINDRLSVATFGDTVFSAADQTITIQNVPMIPSWIRVGKLAVILNSPLNGDKTVTVEVINLTGSVLIITISGDTLVDESVTTFNFDGRIFAIINDRTIAREAENGSTMFNVDVNFGTGLDDGSGVALKYAAHFHGDRNFETIVTNNNGQDVVRTKGGDLVEARFNT